jgi:hypothetical protein
MLIPRGLLAADLSRGRSWAVPADEVHVLVVGSGVADTMTAGAGLLAVPEAAVEAGR